MLAKCFGAAEREEHGLRQTFYYSQVAIVEGVGCGGDNFKQAHQIALVDDGCGKQ